MKKFVINLSVGVLASLLAIPLADFIGTKIGLPEISVKNIDINTLIGGLIGFVFILLFVGFVFFALYLKFKLLDQQDKETAEITKLQIKEEAEIEKLKLQKENQQLISKKDEN